MLEQTFVRPSVIARLRLSPLGPYVDAFAASLHQEGYAPYTIQRFLCAAEQYAQWIDAQGYTLGESDVDLIHRYRPTVCLSTVPLIYYYINRFQRTSGVERPWPGGEKRRGEQASPHEEL